MARPSLRAVVTDVDGTLMNSHHELPEANRQALRRLIQSGVPVVLATGKHRGPWVEALLRAVCDDEVRAASPWTLNAPGVFVQGQLVCDLEGAVVHRKVLAAQVVEMCFEEAKRRAWSVLAYTTDDRVIASRPHPRTVDIEKLGEPFVAGELGDASVFKMIFLADPKDETEVRDAVRGFVGAEATVVVSIPGMVEVLPRGSSKADGVEIALKMLGLSAGEVLALGDGENDIEMLQAVRAAGGAAVAVGNARPALKEVAESVVSSNDEGGWAEAVERWGLLGQ
eukprot:CAMPEP_0170605040 /NCGR_PEP_ID=MMETSP0224-20130122/19761_1 /TAXON_ID=285029 /ORGANISM="Togula jolla, Strain CCCM 725" /LENGTH=281 /DNA_ID=CAMNT_0010930017 /DNA_START=97 /DNA_END=942 /DNA_ORIENTATION=-